jgi:hypothetical protein
MLDMADPSLKLDTGLYAGYRCFVTAMRAIKSMPARHGVHEKASRVAPARLFCIPSRGRARFLWGQCQVRGSLVRRYDAGISTVSTTWITPLD